MNNLPLITRANLLKYISDVNVAKDGDIQEYYKRVEQFLNFMKAYDIPFEYVYTKSYSSYEYTVNEVLMPVM